MVQWQVVPCSRIAEVMSRAPPLLHVITHSFADGRGFLERIGRNPLSTAPPPNAGILLRVPSLCRNMHFVVDLEEQSSVRYGGIGMKYDSNQRSTSKAAGDRHVTLRDVSRPQGEGRNQRWAIFIPKTLKPQKDKDAPTTRKMESYAYPRYPDADHFKIDTPP